MRRVYWLWAAGLMLKLVGASWDVAWHFRLLRETLSPPHLVNLVGEVLVAAALVVEMRRPAPHRRVPLLVILAGAALFLFAIPFDQWWHATFGIDITTWSPAHLLLFSGTAVALIGITLMFLADLEHDAARGLPATWKERAMLAFLLVGIAESFAFPLSYNEYTTIAAPIACGPAPNVDPALVAAGHFYSNNCTDLVAAIFHGTPVWLYPIYSLVFAALLATLVRAALGPGWALVMLVGLSAERAVANALVTTAGWPEAVVPLQYVPLAIAIEMVWLFPVRDALRASIGAFCGAIAGYAYLVAPLPFPHVPVDASSVPMGAALAVAGGLAALAIANRWRAWEARIPVLEWERYPARVAEWWHAR